MTYDITLDTIAADGTTLGMVFLRNAPEDADKIIRLREDMAKNGWTGRPVILLENGDYHIAFTGSHRLAAAHGMDDIIEIVALPDDLTDDEYAVIDAAHDDDDLLAAFIELSEIRDDMAEIVEVMRAEVKANNE